MPSGRPPARSAEYDRNVFVNCPFDPTYQPLFQALVFAVFECGMRPRCALEAYDGGEVRIEKIVNIVRECRWGIHDISRTELNDNGLPRFNMPLELGLFLGAGRFGDRYQRQKSCLVLDRDQYRYQQFMSDIAGQDISAHGNDPRRAIQAVRDWLSTARTARGDRVALPGADAIAERMDRFSSDLVVVCASTERKVGELTFVEFADAASMWLEADLTRVR